MSRPQRPLQPQLQPLAPQLLRSFFKAVASSSTKWKMVYNTLQPYVEPCLSMVLSMLGGPHPAELRGVLLEICLTLPAQLTGVLPLLPRLMRPLTLAIKVGAGEGGGLEATASAVGLGRKQLEVQMTGAWYCVCCLLSTA